MSRFQLKTGIAFAHFGLESARVFEATRGGGMNVFVVQFQMNKKEYYAKSKWILRNLVGASLISA